GGDRGGGGADAREGEVAAEREGAAAGDGAARHGQRADGVVVRLEVEAAVGADGDVGGVPDLVGSAEAEDSRIHRPDTVADVHLAAAGGVHAGVLLGEHDALVDAEAAG